MRGYREIMSGLNRMKGIEVQRSNLSTVGKGMKKRNMNVDTEV
jgi:hypothetical protein